ncbi:I78 family peptidase inhibitor [Bordetella petrii]|uniref:Lipoprotein n=1 Tax=Bordetella petrii (strain ATCC BAA-461 / DSM 12804 / CCUG 43448 / CIP 107267 / Se-1111R) TaxID=340100 RepID=A9IS92_BORPD|nr:I78 family peptidase inhibitor [Bordetella petrii]CAP43272.1 putative lipoprotein [Bordetella petrii]
MIRKLIPVFLAAGLTACATSGTQRASSDAPAAGNAGAASSSVPSAACDAQPVQDLIGKKYSESVASDARTRSQSSQLRVMRPGQVMTMEYNPARLNIILDGGDVITALRCG